MVCGLRVRGFLPLGDAVLRRPYGVSSCMCSEGITIGFWLALVASPVQGVKPRFACASQVEKGTPPGKQLVLFSRGGGNPFFLLWLGEGALCRPPSGLLAPARVLVGGWWLLCALAVVVGVFGLGWPPIFWEFSSGVSF